MLENGVRNVRVVAMATGRKMRNLADGDRHVTAVAFSPDGKLLALGNEYGQLRVIEAVSGKELSRLVERGGVSAVAFSPDVARRPYMR